MIVMCFNDKSPYVEQAKVALKSIQINSPNIPIILYLINFDKNKNIFNNVIIKHVELNNIKAITAYSLHAMYDALTLYKTSILWLDVDVLIRKNLLPIFNNLKPNTLQILKRPTNDIKSIFNTGVVGVGYSKNTINMLKYASIQALNNIEWFADQLYLYKAYEKFKENIDLVNLLNFSKWHDIGGKPNAFKNSSIIWHCKGNHFNEKPYKNEYEFYLKYIN